MWKVNCFVKGLRPNQAPRVYFALASLTAYFLCMGTHIENYDDAELRQTAFSRVEDLLVLE